MKKDDKHKLIESIEAVLSIKNETAAFIAASLAVNGRVLFADPSGRNAKVLGNFLEHATGNKALIQYCSDQTPIDAFLDDKKLLHRLIICERIEALSPGVQSLLGEVLRRDENQGSLFLGLVDSRAEAENISETLRVAFSALVEMPPVHPEEIKAQLGGMVAASADDSVAHLWSLLKTLSADTHVTASLAKGISSLAEKIPAIDPQAVMVPPRIEYLLQLGGVVSTYRSLLEKPQELEPDENLPVDPCVWALAHRLLRIDIGGKTNVGIVQGALSNKPSKKTSAIKNESSNPEELQKAAEVCRKIVSYMSQEVIGRGEGPEGDGPDIGNGEKGLGTIRLIVTALFSQGHILFEDYPGTGKSFMVERLSKCIWDNISEVGINIRDFRRIQCVPDLLPADITGFEALGAHGMTFRPGPVFAYFVLLDEINRTTPKVQSALLEAMAEKRVSVGNHRYDLGRIFFVLATQNPLDNVGTYELPGAQLDRFIFKRRLGNVGDTAFSQIVFNQTTGDSHAKLPAPNIPISELADAIETVQKFGNKDSVLNREVIEPLIRNICAIVEEKIESKILKEGSKPSPRSAQKLIGALKSLAFIEGAMNGNLNDIKIDKKHLRMIGQDYFSHRIFPVRDDMTLDERNKLVNDIITDAIAGLDKGVGLSPKKS
jgi:MoxR-like ATPase